VDNNTLQIITSSSAPTSGFTPGQAVSPLAQAIRFGNMLFVSGLGSVDPGTGDVVEGDIALQTRRTFDNLMSVLQAAGASTLSRTWPRSPPPNFATHGRFRTSKAHRR
jgi:2-iminobutanoate/2-iminopropanoate deaminase